MLFGFHLRDHLFKLTLFINNESGSHRTHVLLAIEFLQLPSAKDLVYFMLGISDEWKWQIVLRDELLVRRLFVLTNTDDLVACGGQSIDVISQVACLRSTARSIVFGVEVDHHFFAFKLAEGDGVAVLVTGGKIGYLLANF